MYLIGTLEPTSSNPTLNVFKGGIKTSRIIKYKNTQNIVFRVYFFLFLSNI